MTVAEYIVSCEDLEFSYALGVKVLDGASLRLPADAMGIIFGKSGTGKSTLLRCLLGYLQPSRGEIQWMGDRHLNTINESGDDSAMGRHARQLVSLWQQFREEDEGGRCSLRQRMFYREPFPTTMVFADCSNALPQLTAEQNIELALAPICADAYLRERAVSLLLDITGLSSVSRQRPAQLSSGQLRRLCLAQSLAVNQRVIVWDEPTMGLDTATKYDLLRFIQALRTAVRLPGLMVTHDIETALLLADEIYLFDNGRIERTINVNIPGPRSPQDIDHAAYRPIRAEMIHFLEQKEATRDVHAISAYADQAEDGVSARA